MLKRMMIAALALIGIFLSIYLTLYKWGYIGTLSCSIGGCERVNTSPWSIFLKLPVAAWGIGFYVTTFVVAFAGTTQRWSDAPLITWILIGLSGVGLVFSAWLTYLELFVIHAICQYCVVSAIVVVLIFGLSLTDLRGRRGASN